MAPVRAVRHRQGCQPSRDSLSVPKEEKKRITSSGPSIKVERRTRGVWWTRLFCGCRFFGLFLPSMRFDAVRCDSLRCAALRFALFALSFLRWGFDSSWKSQVECRDVFTVGTERESPPHAGVERSTGVGGPLRLGVRLFASSRRRTWARRPSNSGRPRVEWGGVRRFFSLFSFVLVVPAAVPCRTIETESSIGRQFRFCHGAIDRDIDRWGCRQSLSNLIPGGTRRRLLGSPDFLAQRCSILLFMDTLWIVHDFVLHLHTYT